MPVTATFTLLKRRSLSYRNQCSSNQWTGFYMLGTSVMKELMNSGRKTKLRPIPYAVIKTKELKAIKTVKRVLFADFLMNLKEKIRAFSHYNREKQEQIDFR